MERRAGRFSPRTGWEAGWKCTPYQSSGIRSVVTTGKKLVDIGIESRYPREEIRDMNGFTAFMIYHEAMIKFTNPKSSAPKAISYGNVWFARMDKDCPMHNCLESEWERLGR